MALGRTAPPMTVVLLTVSESQLRETPVPDRDVAKVFRRAVRSFGYGLLAPSADNCYDTALTRS